MTAVALASETAELYPQRSESNTFADSELLLESIRNQLRQAHKAVNEANEIVLTLAWPVMVCSACPQRCVVGVRSAQRRPFLCTLCRVAAIQSRSAARQSAKTAD